MTYGPNRPEDHPQLVRVLVQLGPFRVERVDWPIDPRIESQRAAINERAARG